MSRLKSGLVMCSTCKRRFTSSAALKRHFQSKHSLMKETGKHTCEYCKTSFKTKWSLATHKSRFHREKDRKTLSFKM